MAEPIIPVAPTIPNAPVAPVAPVTSISNTPYVMTPSAATQLVNQYGIDPNQVLSSKNVAQTLKTPTPKPGDLLGIRAALYNKLGVNTAQTGYETARANAMSAVSGLNERITGLAGRPVSLSKITGTQAQERAVSSNEIARLQDAQTLALEHLNAAKTEAEAQFAIKEGEVAQKRTLQAQYAGAGIKLTDSFDDAIKKVGKFQEEEVKDAYKRTLKAKAMELGLKTSGSRKDLEKRIGKASKNALEEAKKDRDLDRQAKMLSMDNMRSEIANRGKSAAQQDPLLELKKATMEQDLKASTQDYNYKQAQIDAANQPTAWDNFVNSNLNPLNWF